MRKKGTKSNKRKSKRLPGAMGKKTGRASAIERKENGEFESPGERGVGPRKKNKTFRQEKKQLPSGLVRKKKTTL